MNLELTNEEAKHSDVVSAFDKKCAEKLHQIIIQRTKFRRKVKPSTWAIHFSRLRRCDRVPQHVIWETLNWYDKHIRDPYTPFAATAKVFREKFHSILKCRQLNEDGSLDGIEPSDKAIEVAKLLMCHPWPTQWKEQLPKLVQQCFDRVSDFKCRLEQLKLEYLEEIDRCHQTGVLDNHYAVMKSKVFVIEDVLSDIGGGWSFAYEWYEQRAKDFLYWSGLKTTDYKSLVFSTNHPKFVSRLNNVARLLGGQVLWKEITRRLDDEN